MSRFALCGLCWALIGCQARFPDAKFKCDSVADCPGDDFRDCRKTEQSGEIALCFRDKLSETEARRQPAGSPPNTAPKAGATATANNKQSDDGDAGNADSGRNDSGSTPERFVVSGSEPPEGGTLDDPMGSIRIDFSEPIDQSTITSATVEVLKGDARVMGDLFVSADRLQVRFQPSAPWRLTAAYTVELHSTIFSHSSQQLPATQIHVRMRAGRWKRERIVTRMADEVYHAPQLAIFGDDLRVGANVSLLNQREGAHRAYRSTPDGWREIPEATGESGSTGIALLSDVFVFGSQPIVRGGSGWSMRCMDKMGNIADVTPPTFTAGRLHTVNALFAFASDNLWIVQEVLAPDELNPFSLIKTGCSASEARVLQVPATAGAKVRELKQQDTSATFWTEQGNSGNDTPVTLWALRPDEISCPTTAGCPVRISAADAVVDSPAPAAGGWSGPDLAVAWRQTLGEASSVYASVHGVGLTNTWSEPTALSTSDSNARAPLAAFSHGNIVSVWLETHGTDTQLRSRVYTSDQWGAARSVSDTFVDDSTLHPVLDFDAAGNGMLIWAEPRRDASNTYDIHAAAFFGETNNWQDEPSDQLSRDASGSSETAVLMGSDGHAYAAWQEGDALWFGRYE